MQQIKYIFSYNQDESSIIIDKKSTTEHLILIIDE